MCSIYNVSKFSSTTLRALLAPLVLGKLVFSEESLWLWYGVVIFASRVLKGVRRKETKRVYVLRHISGQKCHQQKKEQCHSLGDGKGGGKVGLSDLIY